MRSALAPSFVLGLIIVGCGATGSGDGFDDSDSGAPSWPSGQNKDGGSGSFSDGGFGDSSNDSGDASTASHDGSATLSPTDSGTSSDASTESDASTTRTAPYCQVSPPGGFVGGPSESVTFTGTATEASPLAGAPQAFTLTITGLGVGVDEAWNYDRFNAYVDMTTNLFGTIGSAASEESTFSEGVGGGVLQVIGTGGTPLNSFLLRTQPRSTHFVGTYNTSTTSYSIVIDAPASALPCAAVPNCSFEGTTGDYCGDSIDGFSDTIYHCVGSNPATVVQTCTHGCDISRFGGVECN